MPCSPVFRCGSGRLRDVEVRRPRRYVVALAFTPQWPSGDCAQRVAATAARIARGPTRVVSRVQLARAGFALGYGTAAVCQFVVVCMLRWARGAGLAGGVSYWRVSRGVSAGPPGVCAPSVLASVCTLRLCTRACAHAHTVDWGAHTRVGCQRSTHVCAWSGEAAPHALVAPCCGGPRNDAHICAGATWGVQA